MMIEKYLQQYRTSLLDDVIPFWEKNSIDEVHGGYFTSLDRKGNVFDTDKFIWLQCRQVWTFSMLYNNVEQKQQWLDIAVHGASFLKKHGRDAEGNWYFALNREGNPLVQPYNIFSDCFAAMAFGQLYKATGIEEYGDIALKTFHNILKRQDNPKGKYSKTYPGTRNLKGFSLPMILSNLVLEIEHLLPAALVQETIDKAVHEVINVFYQPDLNLIVENVLNDGKRSDTYEGRLINPGHGLEALWFLMDLAVRDNNNALVKKATDIALHTLAFGWDEKDGGIFYFMDYQQKPLLQLEWDQKLWWVHAEAIVCMLKAYFLTGNEKCWHWFEKLHDYSFSHFSDREYGEWFGYLNRKGEVLIPLKGGKWKGCFHVPRSLYQAWKTLDSIREKEALQLIK
jgi:N-acyl-D-glucosamine 2-epimerase